MQVLNNPNGKQIEIININYSQNNVVYKINEFGGSNSENQNLFQSEISFVNYETQTVKTFDEIFDLIGSKLTDYSKSTDLQNWTIPTGTNDEPTVIRVYLPTKLVNKHLWTGSDLDILMQAMKIFKDYKQTLENGSMQYLKFLQNADKLVLENYANEGIIIEDKI